jgi:hypothetical protein
MKHEKFLRELIEQVVPYMALRHNGKYVRLVIPDSADGEVLWAEVESLEQLQALLFDIIAAHKGCDGLDDETAADDEVLKKWAKQGRLIRKYKDETS